MIPTIQECSVYWHGHLPGNKKNRVKVGTLVRNQEHLYFGYDSRWISRGIEISPGFLPLSNGTKPVSLTDQRSAAYMEDTGLRNEFRGLPGPFYDIHRDRGQFVAAGECFIPDAGDAGGDFHAREAVAKLECGMADVGGVISNCDAPQAGAIVEC